MEVIMVREVRALEHLGMRRFGKRRRSSTQGVSAYDKAARLSKSGRPSQVHAMNPCLLRAREQMTFEAGSAEGSEGLWTSVSCKCHEFTSS
jgi:hypothetical protein